MQGEGAALPQSTIPMHVEGKKKKRKPSLGKYHSNNCCKQNQLMDTK